MSTKTSAGSPLERIDTSFANYVKRREEESGKHRTGGVPDYGFALDYELRKKLDAIPHFKTISKKILSTLVTRQIQIYNQSGLAVGPDQYPKIYQMGVDCAHTLGIGVPNIFIDSSNEMNAFTIASDDAAPIIVLQTPILDRMKPGELKGVIAHECGHIHNEHLVYKNVIQQLLSSGSGGNAFGFVLSMANIALMQLWTRACEVTADRAAVICADDVNDVIGMQTKLLNGGILNKEFDEEINIDAIHRQLDMTLGNPTKILEVLTDHPAGARRIVMSEEFSQCETYYNWRPEKKKPGGKVLSKDEVDQRCKRIFNILDNK